MKAQRWRLFFAKTEAMRFTSHLDLILAWERTFRRSGLPLSYSEGFNPRPVINLAAPLPLGFTSSGEIGDFWLSELVSENTFSSSIKDSLPPGLEILSLKEIPQLHGNKLPSLTHSAVYWMKLNHPIDELPIRIKEILSAKSIPRVRKGKEYDLRPIIHKLTLIPTGSTGVITLETELSLQPGSTGRPEEVLNVLGIPPHEALIQRTMINLKSIILES